MWFVPLVQIKIPEWFVFLSQCLTCFSLTDENRAFPHLMLNIGCSHLTCSTLVWPHPGQAPIANPICPPAPHLAGFIGTADKDGCALLLPGATSVPSLRSAPSLDDVSNVPTPNFGKVVRRRINKT